MDLAHSPCLHDSELTFSRLPNRGYAFRDENSKQHEHLERISWSGCLLFRRINQRYEVFRLLEHDWHLYQYCSLLLLRMQHPPNHQYRQQRIIPKATQEVLP